MAKLTLSVDKDGTVTKAELTALAARVEIMGVAVRTERFDRNWTYQPGHRVGTAVYIERNREPLTLLSFGRALESRSAFLRHDQEPDVGAPLVGREDRQAERDRPGQRSI